MRTHGPRMNPARTREVIDKLGITVVVSNGHGIEIHRAVGPAIERWRVHTGGGIAGNTDKVWLSAVVRVKGPYAPRGPYWNKTQLEKALRAWRRGE